MIDRCLGSHRCRRIQRALHHLKVTVLCLVLAVVVLLLLGTIGAGKPCTLGPKVSDWDEQISDCDAMFTEMSFELPWEREDPCEEAGKVLTREPEADDQSAMVYLPATQRDTWGEISVYRYKSGYYLHGYSGILVDRYEEMIENYHPGLV
ncbi:hypothetical protein Rs2_41598 [Raphanus sativus]|nr:hypothetical protein Rs2_41598 [Raphanus sativus]